VWDVATPEAPEDRHETSPEGASEPRSLGCGCQPAMRDDTSAGLSESECGPDGVATIGYLGWSADAFADGEFVGEAMSEGDKIDRRSNGVLLVHEDILSGGDEDA